MKAMIQMVDRQMIQRRARQMKIQVQKKATVYPIKKQKEMMVHQKMAQMELLRPTAVRQRTVSQMK